MSKKKKNNKEAKPKRQKWHADLKPETKNSIWAILSFAICLILALAHFDKAGLVGTLTQKTLSLLFGKVFWIASIAFFLAGLSFLLSLGSRLVLTTIVGGALFLISSLGLTDVIFGEYTAGYVGFLASYTFLKSFDFLASLIIFITLLITSLLVMLNFSLRFRRRGATKEESMEDAAVVSQPLLPSALQAVNAAVLPKAVVPKNDAEEEVAPEGQGAGSFLTRTFFKQSQKPPKIERVAAFRYDGPPADLLEDDKGTPSSGDIKANANIIKRTLQNFGIDVEMSEVNVGPSVTQYTLKPAEGVKLSRITALQNDLALALAAHPLRMEAPIPGKSLVGIEVPNRSIALVGLRNLLGIDNFKNSNPLTCALGRDVTGGAVFADIAKMPHLLIAGATGSGKSIAMHTLIVSLLYKNSPEFLRFIMVDPKRVELTVYNSLPHLLTPVITDAKKSIIALRWAVKEMERRYQKLEEVGSRDINSYNVEMINEKSYVDILPNIMVIIDELADLMAAFPREMEASIVRLAQMSRAVGIHLVISTQRPSVEVITGLIKANITARVALQVASGVDSRTILDMSGAEKLLGNGDMLYLAGDTSKPRRIQGAFISEKEVKKVAAYVAEATRAFEAERIDLDLKMPIADGGSNMVDDNEDIDDELYEEAKDLVMEAQKASASYLQRRLRVGYARAARLLDILEERGIIGPGEGAKPREVLAKKDAADRLIEEFEAKKEFEEKEVAKLEKAEKKPAKQADEEIPYTNFDF